MGGGRVSISIHLQRPDSVFENCLLTGGTVPTYTHLTNLTTFPGVRVLFFPRVVGKGDPPKALCTSLDKRRGEDTRGGDTVRDERRKKEAKRKLTAAKRKG